MVIFNAAHRSIYFPTGRHTFCTEPDFLSNSSHDVSLFCSSLPKSLLPHAPFPANFSAHGMTEIINDGESPTTQLGRPGYPHKHSLCCSAEARKTVCGHLYLEGTHTHTHMLALADPMQLHLATAPLIVRRVARLTSDKRHAQGKE